MTRQLNAYSFMLAVVFIVAGMTTPARWLIVLGAFIFCASCATLARGE